jgi:hypothetical protein
VNARKDTIIATGNHILIGSALVRRLDTYFGMMDFDCEGQPPLTPAAECVCVDRTS